MTCEYQHWILPYLDGRLDAHQEEKFEIHVKGCSSCMKDFKASEKLLQILRSVRIWARVEAKLAHDPRWRGATSEKQPPRKWKIDRKPKLSDPEKS